MGNDSEEIEVVKDRSWVIKTMAAGTFIGAVVGLVGAFILTKQAEKNETTVTVTPTDGIKIGVLVFGLLRAIGKLGED
jgi:hypothetical protein